MPSAPSPNSTLYLPPHQQIASVVANSLGGGVLALRLVQIDFGAIDEPDWYEEAAGRARVRGFAARFPPAAPGAWADCARPAAEAFDMEWAP
jgi:hypothetical protein